MLFFSTPSSTDGSIPFDTSICRELLRIYIKDKRNSVLIFLDLSLDRSVFSPPKLLSLTLNLLPKWFSSFFKFSLHLVCFFSLIYMHFHVLKSRFWVFWKILGFFKINEFLLKFGLGFSLHEFKISCIAFHVHYNCIFMHLVVCYTCWTACVLVGLDWAEPMMKFLLHVTCSCIPMHTCSIFNILAIFEMWLELFWLSLSSPSLSCLH